VIESACHDNVFRRNLLSGVIIAPRNDARGAAKLKFTGPPGLVHAHLNARETFIRALHKDKQSGVG
jgi:hypothetical protein